MPLGVSNSRPGSNITLQLALRGLVLASALIVFGTLFFLHRRSEAPSVAHLEAANIRLRQDALKLLDYTRHEDYETAARLFREAANNGDILAWMHWAYLQPQYLHNPFHFDSASERRIVVPLRKLADSGNGEAAWLMAQYIIYFQETQPGETIRNYAKISAENGYWLGMRFLGYDYKQGLYGSKDLKQARIWLEKAAGQGDTGSMEQLGHLLKDPDNPEHDFKDAYAWFLRAAEDGYKSSYYSVGWCKTRGIGTKVDRAGAIEWFRKGAALHEPQALFALGYSAATGQGSPKDIKQARKYFEEASALGYDDATAWLEDLDSGGSP
jgi:TPR repeat protein